MHLVGILLYAFLCIAFAWLLAKLFTARARAPWVRRAVTALLAPVVFFLPLADEIVGKFQFDRLCKEAKEVKIYGTISVGEGLYTPEGKALERYVRWDLGAGAQDVPAVIPIQRYENKIYDAKTGRLLAEWLQYSTRGGWLSQNIAASGDKILVPLQCMPEIVQRSKIHQALLKFAKPSEATK